jgi:YidC/Oxa1 family membrane protein insertase
VLLTVIVRVVLIPLTWRQIKSMRAMQALQPQLKQLQEKYKDDRQLLNQKMMEFYRENHVSPFGSCLPLLLQMPVFIGLFYMLREQGLAVWWDTPPQVGHFAAVWHSSPVGWLWIGDITKFDILLMFLYIASQFLSSWQMARKGAGQQKMIAYFMPIIIGVMMFIYKWPAGLFIYWFTSNLWTIAQQFVLEKVVPAPVPVLPSSEKQKTTPARTAGKSPARPSTKTPARPAAKAPAAQAPAAQAPAGKGSAAKAPTAKAPTAKAPTAKSPGAKTAAQSGAKAVGGAAGKAATGTAGKTGGKTSDQKTGEQGKTAGSSGQRPDGGAGGSEGAG